MSSAKKRTYNSEARKAQAAQTRNRILAAARTLFQAQGIEGVRIEQIAHTASVSAPTVYSLFQSKRGILRALIDDALPADQLEALVAAAKGATSLKELLPISAKIARKMYDAERAQMDVFWGTYVVTPEFKALEKEREHRRYQRQEETLTAVAQEDIFKEGLTLPQARDILWAFTGRDMYRLFVVEQGWTSEDYEKWLGQLLSQTLMGDDQ
ncbi:MAG: TetR/AcrR family transcriptional regulator [Alphaproteobacteria bacterium]|nr:TetR/AcrR family transcriptional regulator [Alphaproteobacteria bacterium]